MPLLLCLCLAGCGYRMGGDGLSTSLRGKTVAVPIFANKTYRANLETVLAASLRDELAWRSGGKIADSDTADLVLTGTVVSYVTTPVSYDPADRIREYRATMTVEAALRQRDSGEIVWKGTRNMSQEYPVMELPLRNAAVAERVSPASKIAVQQNAEDGAVREICRKLAQDLLERLNEGF